MEDKTDAEKRLPYWIRLKKAHLCVECKKQDEYTLSGHVFCAECAEKIRRYRLKLKEAHICRECKKQDAYTLAGRTHCSECAEKLRAAKANAWADPEKREKMLLQKREQLARYRNQNKCLHCGKQLHNGERLCGICRERERRASRKSRKLHGIVPRLPGIICWQCNKQPLMDGKKLCPSCYERKVKTARENAKKVELKNHPWRKLDHDDVYRASVKSSPPSAK